MNNFIRAATCILCISLINCGVRTDKGALNRLSKAASPYLREHADNPVDWYEWGPEALDKAKKENKPLIISIGYASCHWCHVMERESFMDTAVARIMNENFVSIKIDREERPDIDQIYLEAAQLISGNGGWPLNAFALPDGKPFYAATYFPKEQWITLLGQVRDAYVKDNENIVRQAEALTKGIRSTDAFGPPAHEAEFEQSKYDSIFLAWQSYLDFKRGGISGAPKFPMPVVGEFLLQYHYLTGNKKALDAATASLDAMARGGIFDQLGGGFARYSTDAIWHVPHFEKMLYDNGQLVSLYSHAYQVTGNELYAEVIDRTLEFIERELTSSEGAFYSSLNADSEGEEGKFYTWTKTEIQKILHPEEVELFSQFYQVTDSGNWENGTNVLFPQKSKEEFAREQKITAEECRRILSEAEKLVMEARNKRIRPSLDDKVIVSWNALMLKGYIDAYVALGKPEYLQKALTNAHFIEKNMMKDDGSLMRTYKDGKATIDGFLDDYALLANAFIQLYQATFDVHWLDNAKSITKYAVTHFHDSARGLFYYTSDKSENLIARKMELADNVIAASNSVMAEVTYLIGEYYAVDSLTKISSVSLSQVAGEMNAAGPYYANWARLMGMIAYGPYEVAVMGDQAVERSKKMLRSYNPTALFMGGNSENLPLLENKLVQGRTIIYVCRNKICKLPVEDAEQAMRQLKVVHQ